MALVALAISGCGPNRLSQPMPGPTPESTAANPNTPKFGEAGGPLVPGNYPPPAPSISGATLPVPQGPVGGAARDFTVYFEFGRATLTSDGRSVIEQAAAFAKQGSMTRITVTGHTDTVGTEHSNLGLSERRAAAVRKALIQQGVPANGIVANGVGQSQLAVPTPDEVKEPRNRRVVIREGGPGV
jgi:outer membrane protein OmpA-like peptidoglycan-associated protein